MNPFNCLRLLTKCCDLTQNSCLCLVIVAGPEGGEAAGHHHEQHHAEAPEIGGRQGEVAAHHLGGHKLDLAIFSTFVRLL